MDINKNFSSLAHQLVGVQPIPSPAGQIFNLNKHQKLILNLGNDDKEWWVKLNINTEPAIVINSLMWARERFGDEVIHRYIEDDLVVFSTEAARTLFLLKWNATDDNT